MCGILGVYNKLGIDANLFKKQLSAITRRGPDDGGIWQIPNQMLALGSRRLAIQDLSPNGHMPMMAADGRHVIVFNGEIYNHLEVRKELRAQHSFASHSDTETVLYAYKKWGTACLGKLNGMFAMAIYDIEQQNLFLARDRVGEKPLYYWYHENGFSFASELKQLFLDEKMPRKLNKTALKQYLEDGFIKGKECFIEQAFKLLPGHYLQYNIASGSLSVQAYWNVPVHQPSVLSKNELVDELDHLMNNAVKRQMISDVPLGVMLSGGVDSSLVTAYAAQHTGKLKTFHISFEGFGKYNEAARARAVAQYFGTEHIELRGDEMNFEMIDQAMLYYDEPLSDSSMLPTVLVSQLTKKHVTVALGGDGGDELFGGYTTYGTLIKQQKTLGKLPSFSKQLLSCAASMLPTGYRGRNFLKTLPGTLHQRFLHNRLFDAESIKQILCADMYEAIGALHSKPEIETTSQFVYDVTKYDFQNYLPDDVLVKVDRASMSASLEMRAPFLDKEVIEFAFAKVPDAYKATESELKILPKQLLKKKMPTGLDVDRKQGFSIPLNDWIADKWYQSFVDEIMQLPGFINRSFAMQMCRGIKKGHSNSSRLFALIVLSKWIKKYKISYE